jgi:hypothetical protein
MFANHVGSETSRFNNLIRSTFAVSEFSNSSSSGITVNLDTSHNEITNSKGNRGARGVGTLTVDSTTLFSQETKDLLGELCSRASEAEEGMDVGGLLLSGSRGWRKTEIKGETKRATDSRNTANNIGAVNRAAVPGVGSSVGSFDEDCVGTTIVAGNSNSFVEEAVEVLDADSLVIATSSNMEIDIEDRADFFEETFEGATVVDDNQTAEADFQKNILDKEAGKIVSSGVVSGSDEYKTGEITHGVHEVGLAAVVLDFARSPEIDMEDVEGAAEGPGEDELAVAGDGAVGGDAVRALKDPIGNIFATERPKEAETDAMQSLVDTHVTSRGRGMVSREDVTTERRRDDDEHEHFLVVLNRLKNNELAVKERETVLADVVAVGSMERGDISFRKRGRRRQSGKQKTSIGVLLIGRSPIERGRNRARTGGGADEGASDKLGGRVGSVDGSEKVDIDEMVDEMRSKVEWAACSEGDSKLGRDGSRRKGGDERRRSRIAEE